MGYQRRVHGESSSDSLQLLPLFSNTSSAMEAIKKKMQAMKVEKDNACDRVDVCEEQCKAAKLRASKAEDEAAGDRAGPHHREARHRHPPAGGEGEAAGRQRARDERLEQEGVRSRGGPGEDRGEDGGRRGQA